MRKTTVKYFAALKGRNRALSQLRVVILKKTFFQWVKLRVLCKLFGYRRTELRKLLRYLNDLPALTKVQYTSTPIVLVGKLRPTGGCFQPIRITKQVD
jgi:hypothetical protein